MTCRINDKNQQSLNEAIREKRDLIKKDGLKKKFAHDLKAKKLSLSKACDKNGKNNREYNRSLIARRHDGTRHLTRQKEHSPIKNEHKDENKEATKESKQRSHANKDSRPPVQRRQSDDAKKENSDQSEMFFAKAAEFGAPSSSIDAASSFVSSSSITSQDLAEFVERIYSCVNTQGSAEVLIELGKGELRGTKIKISSHGKQIKLALSVANFQTKSLLRQAQPELARRLLSKNLRLREFEVH